MKTVPPEERTSSCSHQTRAVPGAFFPAHRQLRVALSVVVPVFDEIENLEPLVYCVRSALGTAVPWELLLVDDRSRDGSLQRAQDLCVTDPRLRALSLDKHLGQTAALAAGFQAARGEYVATLDADLQNDPGDLLAMLEKLEAAAPRIGAVVGYRAKRQDSFVRRASSCIANGIRRRITGDTIRDTGCSTKVFRRTALEHFPLFNGMHRFLTTHLAMRGFEVLEVPVAHHERRFGKSKYGISNRALRAFIDLWAVRWMQSRALAFEVIETSSESSRQEGMQASISPHPAAQPGPSDRAQE